MIKHILFIVCFLVVQTSGFAYAACILTGHLAGDNPGYLYAVAYINGLINADEGFKLSNRSNPAPNKKLTLSEFTAILTNLELAANSFECGAYSVRPQKDFPIDRSNDLAEEKSSLAREVAGFEEGYYIELSKEFRALSSLYVARAKQAIDDIDLSANMAKIRAKVHEITSAIFQDAAVVAHVLVDANPDAAGHMSRLSITARERDDLIKIIDTAFGKRVQSLESNPEYIDASVILIRKWLTRPGYTPKP